MADTITAMRKAPATLATSGGQGHQPGEAGMTTENDTRPVCLLDWCDAPASPDGEGMCRHHRAIELQHARIASRMFYADLADYYRDEDRWTTAIPRTTPARRAIPKVDIPDGMIDGATRYGAKTLAGMVMDLGKTLTDGRSDALMRFAWRAGRLVVERHLTEGIVLDAITGCVNALYPPGDRGDKRSRAERRAMDAYRDAVA